VDTQVTLELEQKGLAREFVRRVQDLRKEADFEVDARIKIEYASGVDPNFEQALRVNQAYVLGETLADSMTPVDLPSGELAAEVDIDGQAFLLAVTRL
jgi:isoleucyl-tRNA synthetase